MLIFNGHQIINTKGLMRIYIFANDGDLGIYGSSQWCDSIKIQSVESFEAGRQVMLYMLEHYSDDLTIDYEDEALKTKSED